MNLSLMVMMGMFTLQDYNKNIVDLLTVTIVKVKRGTLAFHIILCRAEITLNEATEQDDYLVA